MSSDRRIIALIVAAGTGERLPGVLPKQYQPLLNKPVLLWSIEAFLRNPQISAVYTVIHPNHLDFYRAAVGGLELPAAILGGATRRESVRKGLEALVAAAPDYVLIHDGVRPGLSPRLITGLCDALKSCDAVIPGVEIDDTVRRVIGTLTRTENRKDLYAVQTPQGFRFEMILDLHRRYESESVTDDAAFCEYAGIPVKIAKGEKMNFKITYDDDLAMMQLVLADRVAAGLQATDVG